MGSKDGNTDLLLVNLKTDAITKITRDLSSEFSPSWMPDGKTIIYSASPNPVIDVGIREEACPLGLAPTSSTTAAMVMGDALAISLLEARGFTAEDFARSHPRGALGRRLLLLISDVMHTGDAIPAVHEDALLSDALVEMTRKGLGMTAVIDDSVCLKGIFTDGDLRRTLDRGLDVHVTRIGDVMTRECKTCQPEMLAAEALQIMETFKINALLVVDSENRVLGAVNMHDMLRAGVV